LLDILAEINDTLIVGTKTKKTRRKKMFKKIIEIDGTFKSAEAFNAAIATATGDRDLCFETQKELDLSVRAGFVEFVDNKTVIYAEVA